MRLRNVLKKKLTITLIVGVLGLYPIKAIAETAFANTDWTLLHQVLILIKTQYVEKDLKDKDLIYGAVRGMLKGLDDPYSRFIEPKVFEDMTTNIEGEFYGVGIQIGLKDNWLTVIAPIEGTPADKAGIKSQDKIIKVDGKSTEGISTQEAVHMIRGERGTEVILSIKREGESLKDYPIVRDKIDLKSVNKKEIFDGIGYIQLTTFESGKTGRELKKALQKMEKEIKGVVIDLRNNGGGLLDQAVEVTSLFFSSGNKVVYTIDRYGEKQNFETIDMGYTFKKPMVVLVNKGSASASEIFAGAVQDHDRGTIVGEQTFGKASVQNVRPLSDGSAVLLTVAKYYTPNGRNIHEKGLKPDIVEKIPSATIEEIKDGSWEYSYQKDNQLQKSIAVLKENS